MNDSLLRHIIAAVATLVVLLGFCAGYVSGQYGWWWTGFALVIIYGAVYKIIDAGGHGGGHH